MFVIAHADHWALALLEFFPLIAVVAVLTWKIYTDRKRVVADG